MGSKVSEDENIEPVNLRTHQWNLLNLNNRKGLKDRRKLLRVLLSPSGYHETMTRAVTKTITSAVLAVALIDSLLSSSVSCLSSLKCQNHMRSSSTYFSPFVKLRKLI